MKNEIGNVKTAEPFFRFGPKAFRQIPVAENTIPRLLVVVMVVVIVVFGRRMVVQPGGLGTVGVKSRSDSHSRIQ